MQRAFSFAFVFAFALIGCGDSKSGNGGVGGNSGVDPTTAVFARKAPTGGCLADCGPTTDAFFDSEKLATLRIDFDPADLAVLGYEPSRWLDMMWSKWKSCNPNVTWIPATLRYESPDGVGDVTMERVGVRLRGSKGRGTNPLQGMKVEFKKLIPSADADHAERRFADLNQINLLSVERDTSIMLQCMSYELMRGLGVKAPRCNHIKVYVQGSLYGVMQSVEKTNDARFLKHQFGDNDGHLYGGSTSCELENVYGTSLEYKGDVFAGDYLKSYEIVRGDVGNAESELLPMFKCGDPTSTPNDEDFKACISEWIDVDQWLRVIAGESLIPQLESFVGARRNAYFYFLPDATAPHGGRFVVWGWDYDTGLQRATCNPSKPNGIGCDPFKAVAKWFDLPGTRPKLVTRLTSVFKAEYCQIMKSFLEEVYDPALVGLRAATMDAAMQENIAPAYADWQPEVAKMRDYMEQQRAAELEIVTTACSDVLP
ncbi:MAG: CotH kinase family protein [Myxococcota bacterium]